MLRFQFSAREADLLAFNFPCCSKPENILLTQNKKLEDLKVIDFGLATYFKPDQRLHDSVGSAYYKAPEVLHEDYDQKCDVWSCGVICFIVSKGWARFLWFLAKTFECS